MFKFNLANGLGDGFVRRWSSDRILLDSQFLLLAAVIFFFFYRLLLSLLRTYYLSTHLSTLNVSDISSKFLNVAMFLNAHI